MSNDYRFAKKKQEFHAVNMIAKQNPLRKGITLNSFKWKIIDDSSYDGEDVLIIEGKEKKDSSKWIRLYIGDETKSIYKLEKSHLNAVYIYKKNKDGKMVLSYHNREYVFLEEVSPTVKKLLKRYVKNFFQHLKSLKRRILKNELNQEEKNSLQWEILVVKYFTY